MGRRLVELGGVLPEEEVSNLEELSEEDLLEYAAEIYPGCTAQWVVSAAEGCPLAGIGLTFQTEALRGNSS